MEKITNIEPGEWELCNKYNRDIVDEYISMSPQLSIQTKKIYTSNLKIWFNWVRLNVKNKPQYEIRSIEYMKFQNWLIGLKHSSSDVSNKRAAISSLNNYIELYYQEDYPMFRNFIKRGMPKPEMKHVHEKIPPTREEMDHLLAVLLERKEWEKIAYLKYTFDTGCRRAESVQLLKEVIDYKPIVKKKKIKDENGDMQEYTIKYYFSNETRCKGRGETGKVRKLTFSQDTMDAIKKWLEVRGEDDCPYVFTSVRKGEVKQISLSGLNRWSATTFSNIVGRRINPHIFRAAKATISVVEEGKSIESVQHLLGHESSATTEIYIVNDNDDSIDELFI